MRQIDITNKNKDLDLRRFGKSMYTKKGGNGEGGSDDSGGDSGDGEGNNNIFFSPISIQPSYFIPDDEIIDIKDVTVDTLDAGDFLYSKESLVSIGVDEQALNNLEQISYLDTFLEENEYKGLHQIGLKNIIEENHLIDSIESEGNGYYISKYHFANNAYPVIFKVGDNIYRIGKITAIG